MINQKSLNKKFLFFSPSIEQKKAADGIHQLLLRYLPRIILLKSILEFLALGTVMHQNAEPRPVSLYW
jgi:hypothetical protein